MGDRTLPGVVLLEAGAELVAVVETEVLEVDVVAMLEEEADEGKH